MNFITKKNFIFKLIVCVCIFLAIINVGTPQRVYASDDDEKQSIGGMLLNPICDLLLGIGDAIMDITQNSIMGTDATIRIDNTKETNWGAIILGVLAAFAYVALWIIPGTQGIAAAITTAAVKAALLYGAANLVTAGGVHATVTAISSEVLEDVVVLPTFAMGPEEIFGGRVLLFDANIFKPKNVKVDYNILDIEGDSITGSGTANSLQQWETLKSNPQYQAKRYYYIDDSGEEVVTSVNNSAYELREIIQKWYYIIRNIALVGSMLILLYIGIRMIISSVAEEKAKYKQMLSDWVIALCLIVLMHYIMIFAHSTVESITRMFNNMISPGKYVAAIVNPEDHLKKKVEELEDANGVQYVFEEDGVTSIRWPTNMMGKFRVQAYNKDGSEQYVGYVLAYFALVLFTLVFSFTYIKRLLYLLFLTVISPLVALTYPIDKIHDGKAQAFNMWFKEYIFNLLIQPFHLLLYAIFVTMAFDLASQNVIYSLVVIGFMIPAEKFLRTMFGFNKASTPGLFAGAAGAALTMSAVNSLGKFAKGGHGGGKGSGGKDSQKEEQNKLRTRDPGHSQEKLFGELANEGTSQNSEGNTSQIGAQNNAENNNQNNNEEASVQQRMLDAYDENFGTDEWDAQERDAMAREANEPESQEYSADDFRQILEDSGYEEDEIRQIMEEQGYEIPNEPEQIEAAEHQENTESPQVAPEQPRRTIEPPGNNMKDLRKKYMGQRAKTALKMAARTAGSAAVDTAVDMAKFGAKVAVAAPLAAIGGVAGIVKGDPNAVLQNATVAGATGFSIAGGMINRVEGAGKGIQKSQEQFDREAYGADYSNFVNAKMDDKFVKDKKIRKLYQEKLGLENKEEIDAAMTDALKYRQEGINDNEIIIKAMKLDNGNPQNRADNRRLAAAKLAENSKNEKDLEAHMKRFAKVPNMKQQQVEDMERLVRQINNL